MKESRGARAPLREWTDGSAKPYFPGRYARSVVMPSAKTNWAMWLIVGTTAVLAMFIPMAFEPTWTGVVIGFVVAVVIVLAGLAWRVGYDRTHTRRRYD